MKKWYAFLTEKRVLGAGLTAVVALTAFLAVNFYREEKIYLDVENSREEAQDSQSAAEEVKVAEEMNHELPVGSEVGEQQLADAPETEPQLEEIKIEEENVGELAEVGAQTSLVSMNLSFDATQKLQWPVAGREVIKSYSMDALVYYPTLEEYKVCPAMMIQAEINDAVMAPADAIVSEIGANEEIGSFIRMTLSDEYEVIIGNMGTISVSEGDYVLKGTLLGGLAAPTKYYLTEGPNLYLELQKDGQPVDPLDFLE